MIPYPNLDPIALQFGPLVFSKPIMGFTQLGPLAIRWYGLMYILGFIFGYLVLKKRVREANLRMDPALLMDFAFYIFLGVLVGGRIGYILFYNPVMFASNLREVVALWHGGMSFHGGLIGSILSGWIFCRQRGLSYYRMADALIPAIPIGLGLGRLGNFINGELWGRPTDASIAMVFPADPTHLPRHPSQLYEFAMEGVLLFILLWVLRNRKMPMGTLFWTFISGYGLARILGETFREPDAHLSYLLGNWATAGMILSLPMFLGGLVMIVLGYRTEWRRSPQGIAPTASEEAALPQGA